VQLAEATAYVRRGNDLRTDGRFAEAEAAYRAALALIPTYAEAHNNLGELQAAAGHTGEAEQSFQEAISLNPHYAEAHNNLGKLLRQRGDHLGAATAFRRAVEEAPTFAEANIHLAECLARQARNEDAARYVLRAMRSAPGVPDVVAHYVNVVREVDFSTFDPEQANLLHECLQQGNIDLQDLVRPAVSIVKLDRRYATLVSAVEHASGEHAPWNAVSSAALAFLENPLFADLLSQTFVTDLEIEKLVRALRRLALANASRLTTDDLPLLEAIAAQCSNTEYVYGMSSAEVDELVRLRNCVRIRVSPDGDVRDVQARVLQTVLAMYAPTAEPTRVSAATMPDVRQDVSSQRSASVTADVKQQYEENPFPRWLSTRALPPMSMAEFLRLQFPGFDPPAFYHEPGTVLIAGCGTGKQAIDVALRHPDSRVIAIDLSGASLAYGERMAERFGVRNIGFHQLDINDAHTLGLNFELIECSGVLHHTSEPERTWRGLVDLVRPGGVMNIGLYSAAARRTITSLRERNRVIGISGKVDQIREFRDQVIAGELVWARSELVKWRDFFTMSGLRDLVFNVHEDPFDIPRIVRALELCELRFIGFLFRDDVVPTRYREMFPDDPPMRNLKRWSEFEEKFPDTFTGMYQMYCQKQEPGVWIS
jgi:SAM-dependent methyltransferase